MSDRDKIVDLLTELDDQESRDQEPEGEGGSEPQFRRKRGGEPAAPKGRPPWTRKRKGAAIAASIIVPTLTFFSCHSGGPGPAGHEQIVERTFESDLLAASREDDERALIEGQFKGMQPKSGRSAEGKAQGFVAGVFNTIRGWFN